MTTPRRYFHPGNTGPTCPRCGWPTASRFGSHPTCDPSFRLLLDRLRPKVAP